MDGQSLDEICYVAELEGKSGHKKRPTFVSLFKNAPGQTLQNAQCVNAQKTASNDLKQVSININSNRESIISQLNRVYNIQAGNTSQIEISKKSGASYYKDYKITAYKEANTLCTLQNQNCMIIYSYTLPQYNIYNECAFYFDNYKRILPNETTKAAIDKGLNIFKYIK